MVFVRRQTRGEPPLHAVGSVSVLRLRDAAHWGFVKSLFRGQNLAVTFFFFLF